MRFLAFCSSLFRFYEASQSQWRRGQLDDVHWRTIEQQATSLAGQSGIRHWWTPRRNWHSAAFQCWFEALKSPPASTLYDLDAKRVGEE